MKRILVILLCIVLGATLACCGVADDVGQPSASPTAGPTPDGTDDPPPDDETYRVPRDFTSRPAPPADEIAEETLPAAPAGSLSATASAYRMTSGGMRLELAESKAGYVLRVGQESASASFVNETPVAVYVKAGKKESLSAAYDSVEAKPYGYLAASGLTTAAGSQIAVEDRYYFPAEAVAGAFNVRRAVKVTSLAAADTGYASSFTMSAASGSAADSEWFVPGRVFGAATDSVCYSETMLGLPFAMLRAKSGATLSLGRYQPTVHYENNSYASIAALASGARPALEVTYPSRDGLNKYRAAAKDAQTVYDLTMYAAATESYEKATAEVYNAHFALQDQRIVDTDIDEVYNVVNEDFKTFLHTTKQTDKQTGKKYVSYGLPWRISIEDGAFGPLTYQAGFVGQQIPAAYEMMLYGIRANDETSLRNGVNVLDFWVTGAEFMQASGIPKIWYDTWDNGFRAYPTFTRMAVDAMEGLLDAYRLAEAHGIDRPEWLDAVLAYADFLVYAQNADGSWYRCYDWDGNAYVAGANGIPEPGGNICDSFSKNNTTMPVRFLGKIYELTGDATYRTSAIKGGEYVYRAIYPTGVYRGGTCDNPNVKDKEAGVYAMYCWDTMYMLTKDAKYIDCLRQAAAFTMSTVQAFSFAVKDSALKAAKPVLYGYNDGMSFITCDATGVDNYIAFIYYELFRTYVISGDAGYLKQAEFIQQNTKSIMNWDGALGYKYKSLVAEASTIAGFTFSSADDGVWLGWCSVANVEPIAKMLTGFGAADVMDFAKTPLSELRAALDKIGVGGKPHPVYENTVAGSIN